MSDTTTENDGFSPFLLALLALFALSGCAALIYEIVWFQLLQLAVGSTAVSLGILLATFMGGLCIGSLALPRVLPRLPEFFRHPLRTYALIEVLIALFGVAELWIVPAIETSLISGTQTGLSGMLVRGVIAALCLLPPTILMGASLPAIVRWFEGTPKGASRWALLYGANTAGAVFGCLLAGFYLLRLFDLEVASFAAAAVNIVAALASFALAQKFSPVTRSVEARVEDMMSMLPSLPKSDARLIYISVAISGACSLGGEVVWTRLMGLMFGATVYSFSIILAIFLVGLAIGTNIGAVMARARNVRESLGWSQLCAALGIAWTAYCVAVAMPYWPIDPTLSASPLITFELDLARSAIALLPPTIAWGASFSLEFAVLASRRADAGKTVGGIYAANTFGAIIGALGVSLALIPWIGTEQTLRVLLTLSGFSALLVFAPWRSEKFNSALAFTAGGAILIVLLAVTIQDVPGELIAYGRRVATNHGKSEILFTGEGRNTSIAVSRWNDGTIQFHVAGKVEASTMPQDMKLQRMLGHIPALIHGDPKSVLIVGFGAGVTAGSFTQYPNINRIVICELEPLIPPTSTNYFRAQNYDVKDDKRTQIYFDDARHFVLVTPEKFDIITSDPIHPFVKGSAALYSKEYFQMVRDHLNPGGIVTQWVPLYESDEATVKSEIATFMEVFPNSTIYANTLDGGGYDLVIVGQNDAPKINIDAVQTRLDRPDYAGVKKSLSDVGIYSAKDLFSTYAGDKANLAPWTKDAQINHDMDMRLQYLAGLALNVSQETPIYQSILGYRKAPSDIFTGTPDSLTALFSAIDHPAQSD